MSGQKEEKYLVTLAERALAIYGRVFLSWGPTEKIELSEIKRISGGKEPKADIVVTVNGTEKRSVSMKKPNAGFYENWMVEDTIGLLLESAGVPKRYTKYHIGSALKILQAELIKHEQSPELIRQFESEKKSFFSIINAFLPDYKEGTFIKDHEKFPDIKQALMSSPDFGTKKGKAIQTSYKVKNCFINLSDLLGTKKYDKKFLKAAIGGTKNNTRKADFVLTDDVPNPKKVADKDLLPVLQSIFIKIITVDEEVKKCYSRHNQEVPLRFRPLSRIRAAYSRTNNGKYARARKGLRENIQLGLAWLGFVQI
jgi:hypothetical protein